MAPCYADDLVVFLSPLEQDLHLMRAILKCFEDAIGLATNLSKCHLTPIWCEDSHIHYVQRLFPCEIAEFPIKYLGIPLSVNCLLKMDIQPLVDLVANKHPTWKLVAKSSRKGFDTLEILTAWKLWLQRNDRVFNGKAETAQV